MSVPDDLLLALRTRHRMPAGQLTDLLGITRPTLMRAVRALGPAVVSRGRARRTAYAARRALRGSMEPLPLYRLDSAGLASEVATLYPTHAQGCAVDFDQPPDWPLDAAMQEGWFDGLPYFLEDLRPQGFLGRHFARANAAVLQVSDDPRRWSEDDTLFALSVLGSDLPGCYVLGEPALRRWLGQSGQLAPLADGEIEAAYPDLARAAMTAGVAGSSAGGEFPKFPALRRIGGQPCHVLVKFSGSDRSAGTLRWSDLLVCEHLAGVAVRKHLGIHAAVTTIHQYGGRTFLEVQRFDRHGARGRSPVCSWLALNSGMFGLANQSWARAADALAAGGLIDAQTQAGIKSLWHFGQLIANSDMHDGNLSFLPGLQLAPVYDMLPMLYAPDRGVELPGRSFEPVLPIPSEQDGWNAALPAAMAFWRLAAADLRITKAFRTVCAQNLRRLEQQRP
jgi:hypothetical protein